MARVNPVPASRGAFIVFEGIDRCGKTTQSNKLLEYLQGHQVPAERLRFPDRTTESGMTIDAYLKREVELSDEDIHSLFVQNRQEKKIAILDALHAGKTLVVDRYSFSGVAYSAAKGMDRQWCIAQEKGLPAPDLVVYLELPQEVTAAREGFGEERYEQAEFQQKVAEQYQLLKDKNWKVISAANTIEAIHQQIVKTVQRVIDACRDGLVTTELWDSPLFDAQAAALAEPATTEGASCTISISMEQAGKAQRRPQPPAANQLNSNDQV